MDSCMNLVRDQKLKICKHKIFNDCFTSRLVKSKKKLKKEEQRRFSKIWSRTFVNIDDVILL